MKHLTKLLNIAALAPPIPYVVASIPLSQGIGRKPVAVETDLETGYTYVANTGSDDVSVTRGTEVVTTIDVIRSPQVIGIDPARGYVYVGNDYDAGVSVII